MCLPRRREFKVLPASSKTVSGAQAVARAHGACRIMTTMLIRHAGHTPTVHPSAWVAPDATVCGDVTVGAHCRVQYGARLIAEGGRITIGQYAIVMENAVIRSTARHATLIGDHCLLGPHVHLVGCTLESQVFIATGASVFHGAWVGQGAEVRINGVVHLKSRLAAGAVVPIGWVAVGDPASLLPPLQHDAIWAIQQPLNFPWEAYGIDRDEADMIKITRRLAELLAGHRDDQIGE